MKKYLLINLLAILPINLFAQDVWGGVSVATPDLLDAISLNPAGIGIPNGEHVGFYINNTYSTGGFKSEGVAFDLIYNNKKSDFLIL